MVKLYNTYTYSRSFLIETLYTRTLIHSVEGQVNRLSMNVTCDLCLDKPEREDLYKKDK